VSIQKSIVKCQMPSGCKPQLINSRMLPSEYQICLRFAPLWMLCRTVRVLVALMLSGVGCRE
jgi:hypothetical protein